MRKYLILILPLLFVFSCNEKVEKVDSKDEDQPEAVTLKVEGDFDFSPDRMYSSLTATLSEAIEEEVVLGFVLEDVDEPELTNIPANALRFSAELKIAPGKKSSSRAVTIYPEKLPDDGAIGYAAVLKLTSCTPENLMPEEKTFFITYTPSGGGTGEDEPESPEFGVSWDGEFDQESHKAQIHYVFSGEVTAAESYIQLLVNTRQNAVPGFTMIPYQAISMSVSGEALVPSVETNTTSAGVFTNVSYNIPCPKGIEKLDVTLTLDTSLLEGDGPFKTIISYGGGSGVMLPDDTATQMPITYAKP